MKTKKKNLRVDEKPAFVAFGNQASMIGYDVVTAADGEEALEHFAKPVPTW